VAVFVRRLDELVVDVFDDADCDDVADESVALLDDVIDVLDVPDPLFWTSAVVAL